MPPPIAPDQRRRLLFVTASGAVVSILLAVLKFTAGILGRSAALLADAVESLMDLLGAAVVYSGVRVAAQPPDECHPYGHGKAEPLATIGAALLLLLAGGGIAWHSIERLRGDAVVPDSWTLIVVVVVIAVKETLFRIMLHTGRKAGSRAVEADAWHHRSDALTSMTALVGIAAANFGGPAFAHADAWAALLACGIIAFNAFRLMIPAINEVMDRSGPADLLAEAQHVALRVDGVKGLHRCRMRKSGYGYCLDLQVLVDEELPVREGHAISDAVRSALYDSSLPINDVVVHIEPADPDRLHGGVQNGS